MEEKPPPTPPEKCRHALGGMCEEGAAVPQWLTRHREIRKEIDV